MKPINILIISNTAWDISNSFGNTFSNIFGQMENVRIANIYCRYGKPNNTTVSQSFQITEKMLLKNRIHRRFPAGREVINEFNLSELSAAQRTFLSIVSALRFRILFWIREMIWFLGRWQSDELHRFVERFDPDIIFQPIYDSFYLMRINRTLQARYHLPMVGFIGDDFYSLRHFSISPLFWIDRFLKRIRIRDTVRRCKTIYVASDFMKYEYDKHFNIDSKVLMKGSDFSGKPPLKRSANRPLKLVYTGNLEEGRWKSLSSIGEVLGRINSGGTAAVLHIYSHSHMTSRTKRALHQESIVLHGGVPGDEIKQIHADADVLVYAEKLGKLNNDSVRLSFSTKIIDYCRAARCILAYGSREIASMKYLEDNNTAVIAESPEELKEKLEQLLSRKNISEWALRAWKLGEHRHQLVSSISKLRAELESAAEKKAKLLVTTNGWLYKDAECRYFTPVIYGYQFFQRYLDVFDCLILVAHCEDLGERNTDHMLRVDGPGIEIIEAPSPHGKTDYMKKRKAIGKAMKAAVSLCDAAILRVPDQLAFRAYRYLRKCKKPFAAEVTSDPIELFRRGEYKKNFRIAIKYMWYIQLKWLCAYADGVSYVTERELQKRYPAARKRKKRAPAFTEWYTDTNVSVLKNHVQRKWPDSGCWHLLHAAADIGGSSKGHRELLLALHVLLSSGYDVRLTIVGNGRLNEENSEIVEKYNLSRFIEYTGRLKPEEVIAYMQQSDILVYPSYCEGLPRVVVEALSCGLPCILSDIPAHRAMIDEKYLAKKFDYADTADRVLALIRSEENYINACNDAHQAAQKYDIRSVSRKRYDFYAKLRALT